MSRILKPKNKMNMKNLIKYGFIAVVIGFTSCTTAEYKEVKRWNYCATTKLICPQNSQETTCTNIAQDNGVWEF